MTAGEQEEDEDFFAVVDREANQVVEKERKRPNAKKASRIEVGRRAFVQLE